MTDNEVRVKAIALLNERLEQIGGCSDGGCKVVRPKGMVTNGGCKCLRDFVKAQRVVSAYQMFNTEAARQLAELQAVAQQMREALGVAIQHCEVRVVGKLLDAANAYDAPLGLAGNMSSEQTQENTVLQNQPNANMSAREVVVAAIMADPKTKLGATADRILAALEQCATEPDLSTEQSAWFWKQYAANLEKQRAAEPRGDNWFVKHPITQEKLDELAEDMRRNPPPIQLIPSENKQRDELLREAVKVMEGISKKDFNVQNRMVHVDRVGEVRIDVDHWLRSAEALGIK